MNISKLAIMISIGLVEMNPPIAKRTRALRICRIGTARIEFDFGLVYALSIWT